MNRRLFLQGLSALGAGPILGACTPSPKNTLDVYALQNALPSQLIGQFRSQVRNGFPVKISLRSQPDDLFQQLQQWVSERDKAKTQAQRLLSLGDYWLTQAIRQNLIQPLDVGQISGWSTLPPRWRQLVRRDRQGQLAVTGDIWGAPYRWGTTMIAYRHDKLRQLGWQPRDWADLWRPELKGRISLLNHPREVIGLTLKKLGHSYNTTDLTAVAQLLPDLQQLNQQTKFYASTNYLQPLIMSDTWAAVGWSTDILPVLEQESDLRAVIPRSGTAIWSDLWVHPAIPSGDRSTTNIHQWINFWWQPAVAQSLSQFSEATSPLLTTLTPQAVAEKLTVPNPGFLARSEFLNPLPTQAVNQYRQVWTQMRQST